MTKDFKTAQTYDSDTANSGLGWMISGIALGLMVGLGMYFYNKYEVANPTTNTDQQIAQGANTEVPADENSAEAAANDGAEAPNVNDLGIVEPDPISVVIENSRKEQQEKKRASFSYYAVLPNLELDVTVKPSKYDIPAEAAVSDPSGTDTEEPATETLQLKSGSYLLQIASFRTMGQATTAQKKLAKKGLEASIEKKRIRGKDWYRLFIGPTEAEENIASWKAAVEKNGYKPLIIKVK